MIPAAPGRRHVRALLGARQARIFLRVDAGKEHDIALEGPRIAGIVVPHRYRGRYSPLCPSGAAAGQWQQNPPSLPGSLCPPPGNKSSRREGVADVEPGRRPQRYPLKRHDSEAAQQMVVRAAELARDSHARTRHAAVLVKDDSLLAWGTNGVPFPGEDHCYCKAGEFGHHDRCRTHAEQRAITLARGGDGWQNLPGSQLIYVRLEADDSVRQAEPHFCARCSRLALSLGVAQWIFALSDGLVGYSSADYDTIAALRW